MTLPRQISGQPTLGAVPSPLLERLLVHFDAVPEAELRWPQADAVGLGAGRWVSFGACPETARNRPGPPHAKF